jgi:hypothetical protein
VPAYPADIEVLLDDVRQLRTTMASDLSAAAAAVDSDAQGVARDIIAANRDDLAALGRRVTDPAAAPPPILPKPRHRDARQSVMALGIPLLAATAVSAAALTAYTGHRSDPATPAIGNQGASAGSHPAAAVNDAHATLLALTADLHRGAGIAVITADALRLRDQLASLAAGAAGDGSKLAAVHRMLTIEERLLSRYRMTVTVPTPAATAVPVRTQSSPVPRRTQHSVRRVKTAGTVTPEPATPQPTATTPLPLPSVAPSVPDSVTG